MEICSSGGCGIILLLGRRQNSETCCCCKSRMLQHALVWLANRVLPILPEDVLQQLDVVVARRGGRVKQRMAAVQHLNVRACREGCDSSMHTDYKHPCLNQASLRVPQIVPGGVAAHKISSSGPIGVAVKTPVWHTPASSSSAPRASPLALPATGRAPPSHPSSTGTAGTTARGGCGWCVQGGGFATSAC